VSARPGEPPGRFDTSVSIAPRATNDSRVQPMTREASEDRIRRLPSPFRARAWWGDELVADSTAAVRVDESGRPPALCFPVGDIRLERFRRAGVVTCPVKGTAQLWSIGPSSTSPGGSNGHGVLSSFTEPSPGAAWLSGLATFDHDRVRVELVDGVEGDAERDITVKQFPTWGDASDLVDILDVRPAGERRYVSVVRDDARRPVVEGSQMLGQAIVAAGRHAPGRRAVSAHMVFLRAADTSQPLQFDVDELSAGRTFTTVAVHVNQNGRRCATGTLLLDTMAPDVIRHSVAAPDVAGPYASEPCDMSVTGRDLRVVGGAYTGDPNAPVGPPVLDTWVRFRAVPDDPYLHAALLAQFTGHMSIAAAMRPHEGIGQDQAHRTLSTGINAIAISLHGDVRADRWMLYHHLSTFAGDGMTHSECRVHGETGELLASFTVDAMVRPFASTVTTVDERTAL
jgi:acyl-CoA thioesterase-2